MVIFIDYHWAGKVPGLYFRHPVALFFYLGPTQWAVGHGTYVRGNLDPLTSQLFCCLFGWLLPPTVMLLAWFAPVPRSHRAVSGSKQVSAPLSRQPQLTAAAVTAAYLCRPCSVFFPLFVVRFGSSAGTWGWRLGGDLIRVTASTWSLSLNS